MERADVAVRCVERDIVSIPGIDSLYGGLFVRCESMRLDV